MTFLGPLLLSAAIWLTGVNTREPRTLECAQASLLGTYSPATDTLVMCEDNIEESDYSYETIRRHELVHAVQERMGHYEDPTKVIIPEPYLTHLVRELMDDEITVSVLLTYPEEDRHAEFEARLLQHAPSEVIAVMLVMAHLL